MSARRTDLECIAVTRPGLEAVCAGELADLGVRVTDQQPGAVAFTAAPRGLYLVVRWARTPVRLLVVAGRFRAHTFDALARGLAGIDWSTWVVPGGTVEVRARTHRARLYHTGAVEERVLAAVADQVGPAADGPPSSTPVRVDVRIDGDTAVVRVDATGEPADRRGWRLATGKAPLPPTVAAAALAAIGWDGTLPLLDPMCGAGTIAIEGALRAAGREPLVDRPVGLQVWPSFAPGTWASAAVGPTGAGAAGPAAVLAGDRDAGAVDATRANAARAGVDDVVRVAHVSLSGAAGVAGDHGPGWVVTNPPWGRRIEGGGDLRDLYAALRALVDDLGWRLALISADQRLAGHAGTDLEERWRTRVAGQHVRLLTTP